MRRVADLEILRHVGRTPFDRIEGTGGAPVWVKLEGNNPGGSVKDRAAWGMLLRAEERGLLVPGATLVEPTSGNTGIGLALLGSALGLRVVLAMPESMSAERRGLLRAFGAELVLTPGGEGMQGAVRAAEELLHRIPGSFTADQFANPGNPWAHRVTTAPEMVADLRGLAPAAFVAGVGTGGTFSGVTGVLKTLFPDLLGVAVEPASSPLLSQGRSGSHRIQGIGANFVPANLDRSLVDRIVPVEDEAALDTARWLARAHGLFSGISTGANLRAALDLAATLPPDRPVLTIQCDRGDRYLSVLAP